MEAAVHGIPLSDLQDPKVKVTIILHVWNPSHEFTKTMEQCQKDNAHSVLGTFYAKGMRNVLTGCWVSLRVGREAHLFITKKICSLSWVVSSWWMRSLELERMQKEQKLRCKRSPQLYPQGVNFKGDQVTVSILCWVGKFSCSKERGYCISSQERQQRLTFISYRQSTK